MSNVNKQQSGRFDGPWFDLVLREFSTKSHGNAEKNAVLQLGVANGKMRIAVTDFGKIDQQTDRPFKKALSIRLEGFEELALRFSAWVREQETASSENQPEMPSWMMRRPVYDDGVSTLVDYLSMKIADKGDSFAILVADDAENVYSFVIDSRHLVFKVRGVVLDPRQSAIEHLGSIFKTLTKQAPIASVVQLQMMADFKRAKREQSYKTEEGAPHVKAEDDVGFIF